MIGAASGPDATSTSSPAASKAPIIGRSGVTCPAPGVDTTKTLITGILRVPHVTVAANPSHAASQLSMPASADAFTASDAPLNSMEQRAMWAMRASSKPSLSRHS